jgi:hypothetical protein
MNEDLTRDSMQNPGGSVRFGMFTAMVFAGNALGMAIFVGFGGLILGISSHRLLMPYTTLLYCGLVLSPLLYWARLSRGRHKSCALRFATAILLYLQAVMLALGFSAIKLNVLSQAEAISDFGLLIVPLSAFTFAASYLVARRMLGTPKSG